MVDLVAGGNSRALRAGPGARVHDHPERRVRRAGPCASPVACRAPALAQASPWRAHAAPLTARRRPRQAASARRAEGSRDPARRPGATSATTLPHFCPPGSTSTGSADATPGTLPARRRWTSAQLPFFGADPVGEADVYSHALYGIRARRPWADVDVWELFLSLPAEVQFPDYRMKGFTRNALRRGAGRDPRPQGQDPWTAGSRRWAWTTPRPGTGSRRATSA